MSALAQAWVMVVQSIRVAEPRGQQTPFGLAFPKKRYAGIARAGAVRTGTELGRVIVEPRCLGEEITHKVAGAVAQQERTPIADNRKMAAVAGYQQIG